VTKANTADDRSTEKETAMNSDTKTSAQTDFELTSPKKLLDRDDLTRDQKVEVLRQWELDLREGMVAEEENMPASEPMTVTLDEVLDALRSLGAESQFHNVTTKHG
jgi:hypothetical protein